MKLVWSPLALADRDNIFDYIVADNPRAAITFDECIQQHIEKLIQFPELGRFGRVIGTRELVLSGTPYIAAYSLKDNKVLVLRILHGAQQWPEELDDN